MIHFARRLIEREPSAGRLAAWWRITAGAMSGLLIVGALAVVFLAGFIELPAPPIAPAAAVHTVGQRAAALPVAPVCQPTRHHRCGHSSPSVPQPSAAPSQVASP